MFNKIQKWLKINLYHYINQLNYIRYSTKKKIFKIEKTKLKS